MQLEGGSRIVHTDHLRQTRGGYKKNGGYEGDKSDNDGNRLVMNEKYYCCCIKTDLDRS